MSTSIYLVNPASDFPTYFSAEVFAGRGLGAAAFMADLSIATLAGMFPDDFHVSLCDENISPVDFDHAADYVGITGKVTQRNRMAAIASEFRKRGKVVIIGGSYASLAPEYLRPHCDILVRGESEAIIDELASDLSQSCWKEEYVGDRPDLSRAAIPKWEGYPNGRALMGALQTSRGCPFECEFCDVIQYLGRKQRHKSIPQVLAELDELYRYGYRSVFLADDNFTASRSRAKELLSALRDWNRRQTDGRVWFTTQVSIDAAKNEELIRMCAEAGIMNVFIGIETPNESSLKETKKRQNVGINLNDYIQRFLDQGISVIGGMIVGFDNDGPDIFKRQFEFAMSTPIPMFTLGALVAPEATPLYDRMVRENRLAADGSGAAAMPWSTNIIPRQMTREQLFEGIQWLCNSLYHPAAFAERASSFIDRLGERTEVDSGQKLYSETPRPINNDAMRLLAKLFSSGRPEDKVLSSILSKASTKPQAKVYLKMALIQYAQIRYMYEQGSFWDCQIATGPPPEFVMNAASLPIAAAR
jgi:radical SAM superfamily enzyme YgiQ (UPF0313 family)